MGAELELYGLKKDGAEFSADIALGYLETENGIIVLSIVRDITEQKLRNTQLNLLLTLTQAINESKDLNSAMEIALKKVCEATGWNYGEAWIPIQDGQAHVHSPVWYSSDDRLLNFRKISEKYVFYPGTGLPGRVWLSKQPEWIPDVAAVSETVFPRVNAARELGIKAGLGVPIIVGNIVVAVLVFLMFRSQEKDAQMVGIVTAVAAQLSSVVRRKRVDDQLRATLLYAHSLFEASIDPLVTISPEGKITDVNKASELVTGVPRENLIGSDFSSYLTEPEKAIEMYRQVLDKDTVRDYPLAIRHISRKVTDVLYNATVYKNEAGVVQGIFAAARDITEHKRMEEALRISEAKYREIFENAPEGIFQTSFNGRILAANPAVARILGYDSPEELIAGTSNLCP